MRATTFTVQERRDDATPDHKRERGRGQALVEFAIVLPVFFLVVAGMFDFGLGIYSDLTLVNAARESVKETNVSQVAGRMERKEPLVLIDVREESA
mgnify:CR=1 FL=1